MAESTMDEPLFSRGQNKQGVPGSGGHGIQDISSHQRRDLPRGQETP